MRRRDVFGGFITALALTACSPSEHTAVVEAIQRESAMAVVPLLLTAQAPAEAAAKVLPLPLTDSDTADTRVVRHIVRWEVGSPRTYAQKWQGVICPPGASGPTWGIGYDGGHQTPDTILRDWAHRSDVDRLAATSGQTGSTRCRAARVQLRDVRVPWGEAEQVFTDVSMPAWTRATRRTYPGVEALGVLPEGALIGNTYNRGTSMSGSRAAEKRYIRDVCVPRSDIACVAAQLRAQKRLWPDVPGLRERRESEARLAEGGR